MRVPPQIAAKILAQVDAQQPREIVDPKPARKSRLVALDRAASWSVTLVPACRVVTEANTHEHWTRRKRRFDVQRAAIRAAWHRSPLRGFGTLPLTVTLTHIGPRMDDDNLQGAFKGCRDEIADLIGVDDGDARVKWEYDQRTGEKGITITIAGG